MVNPKDSFQIRLEMVYLSNQIVRHKFPQDKQYCDVLFSIAISNVVRRTEFLPFFLVQIGSFVFVLIWCIESCQNCNANDRSLIMCTFSHKTLFAFDAFYRSLSLFHTHKHPDNCAQSTLHSQVYRNQRVYLAMFICTTSEIFSIMSCNTSVQV